MAASSYHPNPGNATRPPVDYTYSLPIATPFGILPQGFLGYNPSGQEDPNQIEIAKTPLGAFSLGKYTLINSLLLAGGTILIILGIGGLIWSNPTVRETTKTAAATAAKAAVAA